MVHLLFTTGHTAPASESLQRRDLAEPALDLARMLRQLLPNDPAVAGLLTLILLTDARRHTRTSNDGRLLLLAYHEARLLADNSVEQDFLTGRISELDT